MPKMPQPTIVPVDPIKNVGNKIKGRNDATLQAAFSSSPLYGLNKPPKFASGEALREYYVTHVIAQILNDDGTVMSSDYAQGVSISFANKDLKPVETGGGGLPATAFLPNPTSPGAENGVDAGRQSPPTEEFIKAHSVPNMSFPGQGASLSPIESSEKISKAAATGLATIGGYLSGKSSV